MLTKRKKIGKQEETLVDGKIVPMASLVEPAKNTLSSPLVQQQTYFSTD
jgi:hypothetical protein